jgi:hypothetical protein
MTTVPSYTLELRAAADQRRRLQSSIAELRSQVRERFAINKKRNELPQAIGSRFVASFVVLLALTRILWRSHGRRNR